MVFRISGFSVGGTAMRSHFSKIQSSIVRSSLKLQKSHNVRGHIVLLFDQPSWMISLSSGMVLSFAVSCLICCSLIGDAGSVLVM